MKYLTVIYYWWILFAVYISSAQPVLSNKDFNNLYAIIPDFQVNVNSFISNASQVASSITTDSNGNFIITWGDDRNGDGNIYAQRYLSNGTALDSNFQVNDDASSAWQDNPSISADIIGNFVIAWEDERNGQWIGDIYAQRYASNGTALGSNFIVNDDQGNEYQHCPSITTDGGGNFIITWEDARNGGLSPDIYTQRYLSNGTAVGGNFKVNDDAGSARQRTPSISADDNGNFVISWGDDRNGNADIYAQRYASDGTAIDSNFKVNYDVGSAWQGEPSISADSSGNFNIIWIDGRTGNYYIYVQRYASNGTALGSNFKVNVDLSNPRHCYHSISADDNGNFIIIWQNEHNNNLDIYAQRYLSDGSALGNIFRSTKTSEGDQFEPDVELLNGRIYNTWTDDRDGRTGDDIWANVLNWNDPIGATEKEISSRPKEFHLNQNYPNPFNPSTTIQFDLPKTGQVTLKVFNVLGEELATLVSNRLPAGSYSYEWDASSLASGVYLYRLQAGNYVKTRKMVMMK